MSSCSKGFPAVFPPLREARGTRASEAGTQGVRKPSDSFLKRNGVALFEVRRLCDCGHGDLLSVVTEFGGVRDCQRLDI